MGALRRFTRRNRGFTLIELLVVIAIIGILSAIALVQLNDQRGRARNAQRVASARTIQLALQLYYDDYGRYPGSPCTSRGDLGPYDSSWYALKQAIGPYLSTIPNDPILNLDLTNNHWHLITSGIGDNFQHYVLQIPLEPAGANNVLKLPGAIPGTNQILDHVLYNNPTSFEYTSNMTSTNPTDCTQADPHGTNMWCGRNPNDGRNVAYYCVGNVYKTGCTGPYNYCLGKD